MTRQSGITVSIMALLALLAAAAFAAMSLAQEPPREFTATRDSATAKLAWTEPELTFSPPAHMTSVWWHYDGCGCHQYRPSQTIDFTIHAAPEPPEGNGIYLMVAYGEIGGAGYYVGLQTNLVDTENRGLIFSRWRGGFHRLHIPSKS